MEGIPLGTACEADTSRAFDADRRHLAARPRRAGHGRRCYPGALLGSERHRRHGKLEEPDPAHLPARMVIASLLGDSSLRDRLEDCHDRGEQGIPLDELLGYMHEAAKGIDYLNSVQHDLGGDQVGVQHCDIKPDNILLTGGSVVIADFGVAQVFSGSGGDARATSLSGSPAYMAPEAFDAAPSEASDQYSLAMTYYELRTGSLPLSVDSFAAAYDAHRSGKLDFSRVSEAEQEVLRQAAHTDPNERFENATSFVKALSHALEDEIPVRHDWSKTALVAISVAAVLLVASLAALWLDGPATTELVLRFDAPGATVVVNGEEYVLNNKGELKVYVIEGAPVSILAKGNADRRDEKWSIESDEIGQKELYEFSIPYTAEYHAARAEGLLAKKRLDKATEAYALAIRASQKEYSKLPEPLILTTGDVLWDDCLQLSPDGTLLVVGDREGVLSQWRIHDQGLKGEPSKEEHPNRTGLMSVATSDALVAYATDTGEVWVAGDSAPQKLFTEEGSDIKVAFTGDQQWLAAAVSADLVTKIYVWNAKAENLAATERELGEQPGEFPRICSSRDDAIVLATQDAEALVWSWSVNLAEHLKLGGQQSDVLSLVSASSGDAIAYVGVANSGGLVPGAALYDVAVQARYTLPSQTNAIPACALNGSGDRLATAERMEANDANGLVLLWRPRAGDEVLAMERVFRYDHRLGDVTALVISNDSHWLAAGHETGAVTIWHVLQTTEQPVTSFGGGGRIVALRSSPDERWLFGAARDGRVIAYDLLRLQMVYQACLQEGVAPVQGADRVTLRDRPFGRATHSLLGSARTWFPLAPHPSATHAE